MRRDPFGAARENASDPRRAADVEVAVAALIADVHVDAVVLHAVADLRPERPVGKPEVGDLAGPASAR
jgi:hypothetical protein